MKEQLDSLVLQMYRAGARCSEAVREFQRAFILTVLKDQRGNQCKAAEKLGMHRNTLRRTIRDLEIDIGPTRATGRRRPPRSDVPTPSVRRQQLELQDCELLLATRSNHFAEKLITR
jgi:Fis family transcriptional regulator